MSSIAHRRARAAIAVAAALVAAAVATGTAAAQNVELARPIKGRNPAIWLDRLSTFALDSKTKKVAAVPVDQHKVYVGDRAPPRRGGQDWGVPTDDDDRGGDPRPPGPVSPSQARASAIGTFGWHLTVAWLKTPALISPLSSSSDPDADGSVIADVTYATLPQADRTEAITNAATWAAALASNRGTFGLVDDAQVTWLKTKFKAVTIEDDLTARKKIRNVDGAGYAEKTRLLAATMDATVAIYIVDKDTLVYFDPDHGPRATARASFFDWGKTRTLDTFMVVQPN